MNHSQFLEYENEYAEYLFDTSPLLDKDNTIRIVRGGRSEAKPTYRVGPKRIECYSIHFVRKGSLMLEYRKKRVLLQSGDLFCLYPNITYTYYRQSDEEEPLQLSWLAFDGTGSEQLLKLAGFDADFPIVYNCWNLQLEELLQSAYAILRMDRPPKISDHLELKSLLYQLFSLLIQANGDPETIEPMGWIKASADYIELHASEGITVQQVARMTGHNRTYFSTVFSKTYGIPPAEYIYKIRMNRAKDLLLGTSASITEIAYSLGYPNLFTFTRAFKKFFSLSPSEYRNRNRKPVNSL
jgi:AraC-like DNA-binding protein